MKLPGERTQVQTPVGTRSRTKQANRNETNINLMVARYKKTGQFQNLNPREPKYGDYSAAVTLEQAYQAVFEANQSFMELPAAVRAVAQNNPITLLEMLADEGATQALVKAGLPIKDTPPVGENPATQDVGAPAGDGVSQTN